MKHLVTFSVEKISTKDVSIERLTPRQREVMRLVAEGNTNKVIARILHVSVKTVEKHRAEMMGTLGIRDTATLVRFAVRMGVVSPDGE